MPLCRAQRNDASLAAATAVFYICGMREPDPTIPTEPKPEPVKEPGQEPPVSEPPAPENPPKQRLDPTRYGDWELNGKCVDF